MALPSSSVLLDPETILRKAGIRAGVSVADLGCGTVGHFVIPAAKMVGPEGKVFAVDIVKGVLAGVESRAKLEGLVNLQTVWGDCERANGVRIPTNSVDITLVINNLYQAGNRQAFLREAARLTKVGGKILVIDWKIVATPLGPPSAARVSADAAKTDAVAADIRFVEAFEPGPYHWGLLFTK